MSYLDSPRFHFFGQFFANPSTINNSINNYSPTADLDDPSALSWNPNGPAFFSCIGAVTGACLELGTILTSGDPVIGSQIVSIPNGQAVKVEARLADLDPDQQIRTLIIGLQIQVITSQGVTITGTVRGMTLTDEWGRLTGGGGASGIQSAGGMYQSVLDNVQWTGMSDNTSAVLQQLYSICLQNGNMLSLKVNLDGFNGNPNGMGRIAGTIGPYYNGEPVHLLAKRRMWGGSPLVLPFWPLAPAPSGAPGAIPTPSSPLNAAPFQISNGYLSLDLGNSIPTLNPSEGSFSVNGTVDAIADPNGANVSIGTVYSSSNEFAAVYNSAAGIVDLQLTSAQEQALASAPLALLLVPPPDSDVVGAITGTAASLMKEGFVVNVSPAVATGTTLVLAEDPSGLFSSFDFNALRLQNGAPAWSPLAQSGARVTENVQVPLYATKFGQAAPNVALNVQLLSGPPDNTPVSAITFPTQVQTDNAGMALVSFAANDLSMTDITANDPRRQALNSQLYFFMMDGAMAGDSPALTLLVFENTPGPANPTWTNDISPIFTQYARLYRYMTQKVIDLSNYTMVVSHKSSIMKMMQLPPEDPGFMPVTRDLAPVQLQTILTWFNNNTPE